MTSNQQAAREWRPISEAPKDGRWILVYDEEYGAMEVARWDDEYINPFSHVRGDWFDSEWKCAATHWQPLPAPPGPAKECAHQWRVDPDFGEGSGYLYCPRCDCTRRSPTPPDSGEAST